MKQWLVACFVSVACAFGFSMGLGEKVQANNSIGLLGAVGTVKGEHKITFSMKEDKAQLLGNQKWQFELSKKLSDLEFTVKDVLNTSIPEKYIDNTLTFTAGYKITDSLNTKYTGIQSFRLTDRESTSYKGFEHRLDAQHKSPVIDVGVTLRSLNRTHELSSSDYKTYIYQASLGKELGRWGHKVTVKAETQEYSSNVFRDYILTDMSYNGKIHLSHSTINVVLQHENKRYAKNRYDGYEKKVIGASLVGSFFAKNDVKISVEYLDRIVPEKADKRYTKTTVGGSGAFSVLDGVIAKLEFDNIVLAYPHVLPEQNSGDYVQRKGKISFSGTVLFSTQVSTYFGFDMKDFASENRADVNKWSWGFTMEYRKGKNTSTVATVDRQGTMGEKTAGTGFQIKHARQVDKGLEYELTYTKNSKESSVSLSLKHSM